MHIVAEATAHLTTRRDEEREREGGDDARSAMRGERVAAKKSCDAEERRGEADRIVLLNRYSGEEVRIRRLCSSESERMERGSEK